MVLEFGLWCFLVYCGFGCLVVSLFVSILGMRLVVAICFCLRCNRCVLDTFWFVVCGWISGWLFGMIVGVVYLRGFVLVARCWV